MHLHGRTRTQEELSGIYDDILLVRARDNDVYETGQDGGLVSAMLIWLLANDVIDGALTSGVESLADGSPGWKALPMVATNREEVLRGAGSRYTYSANTMAFDQAMELGLSRLALVGMSCQSSVAPVMWHRKVGKVSKPIKLNIGLLCSKSFDDSMFDELFDVKYGLAKEDIAKMNIKGVFQIWMRNGDYHEINLKECHAWTREGCLHCPDFAAEHADISTGGIGNETDWTLTVVRTELGRAVMKALIDDGVVETRPGDDDPAAIALMHRLAANSRKRWPDWADSAVSVDLTAKATT
jgi:coenzyme F420 hydrogenase subunit beta